MIKTVCAIAVVLAVMLACSREVWNLGSSTPSELKMTFDEEGYWKTPNFRVKLGKDGQSAALYGSSSVYGAFLAGRVAQMRQDFDTASEYYKIVLEKDEKNVDINRSIYLLLTSVGDIKGAAKYAQKEIDNGIKNTLAPLIVAINDFAEGRYEKVRTGMATLDNTDVYKKIITPLFEAWSYAAEGNQELAIKSIDKITKDPFLDSLKLFHKAMIYDCLGDHRKAAENYSYIYDKKPQDITYRMLEIITDFYVRNGEKDRAYKISNRYNDDGTLAVLLADINKKIDEKDTQTPAIINTPQKGMAEALFNIGTIFRISAESAEYAQIYTSASIYLNPEYDVAQIAMANILEENGFLKEANKYYAAIDKQSGSYFIAQIKMIENLNLMEEYAESEDLLRKLLKDYPNNTQLLNDLGDIARNMNKNSEAIKIYKKALASVQNTNQNTWPIFYSLGVAYDRDNQKNKAEENLKKALELSERNANVLNYLGYTWLVANKNTDEAIKMIVEAYRQYPYEGHIIDSMGWVYFKLGEYQKSISYLEYASDLKPANAVISDHLGDAYWHVGRKNEAIFQWKHALVLKEDADTINKNIIKQKIEEGLEHGSTLTVSDEKLRETLRNLDVEENKNDTKSTVAGGVLK